MKISNLTKDLPRPRRRWSVVLMLSVIVAGPVVARDQVTVPEKKGGTTKYDFHLLPRSMQRRPKIDIWVFTEMTPRGQLLAAPSPEAPVYYVAESGGYHSLGESVAERPATALALSRVMGSTLRAQGLLPADEANPATLALVYTWGSHNREMVHGEPMLPANALADGEVLGPGFTNAFGASSTPYTSAFDGVQFQRAETRVFREVRWSEDRPAPMRKTDQIERAALLVGDTFARKFRQDVASVPEDAMGSGPAMSQLMESAMIHPRGRFLMQTINQSLYFVVVTAYDAGGIARGRKEPLWRTKIAVTSDGIGMAETTPSMLVAAAPYIGRETNNGALIQRQIDRRGNVVIGEPEVIGWESGDAVPATEPKKEKK